MNTQDVEKAMDEKTVAIIYCGDVAYIGSVLASELANPKDGITVDKPFVLNIRPIPDKDNEEQLNTVLVELLFPIEFCGLPVTEKIYSGFVGFAETSLQIDHPNIMMAKTERNEPLAVFRLASLGDRTEPKLKVYAVDKILEPSDGLEMMYRLKSADYKSELYSKRAVEYGSSDEPKEREKQRNAGNVIEFESPKSIN